MHAISSGKKCVDERGFAAEELSYEQTIVDNLAKNHEYLFELHKNNHSLNELTSVTSELMGPARHR